MFRAPFTDGIDPETGQGRVHPDYAYGAQAVEVAVDTETGEVSVLKCVGAHDVGQAINPDAVEGQIEHEEREAPIVDVVAGMLSRSSGGSS